MKELGLKGEVVIVPNGGGTIYVSEVLEVSDKWYAVCTPIVPTQDEDITKGVQQVLSEYPDTVVLYVYEIVDKGDKFEMINPDNSCLSDIMAKVKQLDFLGELS